MDRIVGRGIASDSQALKERARDVAQDGPLGDLDEQFVGKLSEGRSDESTLISSYEQHLERIALS